MALLYFVGQATARPVSFGVSTGIVTSYQLSAEPLMLAFELRSVAGDEVSVTITDIVNTNNGQGWNGQWRIIESDAASYGVDWSAWESIINTRQTTGQLYGTLTFGNYVDDRGPADPICCFDGYFDLNEIVLDVTLNAQGFPGWFYAAGIVRGNDSFVLPEPLSAVMLLILWSWFVAFSRYR